tara:strand:+ start:1102 stop:1455 length:354 start_codon:yes stop_codon:yes gene_type:complete
MAFFEVKSDYPIKKSLQKVRKNDFLLVQQCRNADEELMNDKYQFFVQGSEVPFSDFVQAADDVENLYRKRDEAKYARLFVPDGSTGLQKKMIKVRRDRLNHINSENCQCQNCYKEKV